MKITHCIFSFNTGGAETMLIDIVNEQIRTQQVSIIIINDSFQKELIEQIDPKVQLVFIKRKPHNRSVFPILKLNWILYKLHPDIIHVHNYMLPRIIFPFGKSKLFMTVHDLHIPLKHVNKKTNLIAISNAVRDDIALKGNYKTFTIPNGINIERIEKRACLSFNGKLRIVQVASLNAAKKGQDILINALALLKKRGIENIEISFIGTGKDEFKLKELAKNLNVTEQVHFLGLKSRQYIYSHLKEFDLMCHPSRYEGFGLTVAEGVAAMLPVLVPAEGGPFEIIKRGELGYTFQSGNIEDCADHIELIQKNYAEALTHTIPAYDHVLQNYSINRMVNDYLCAYNQ